MRERKVRAPSAQAIEAFEGAAGKLQARSARFIIQHLNLLPGDAFGPARPQGFHRRLFGGKPRGVTGKARGAAFTIGDLRRREQSIAETDIAARKLLFDARNLYDIYADRDDHCFLVSGFESELE